MTIRVYEVLDPWPRAYFACRSLREPDPQRARMRSVAPDFDPRGDVVLEQEARSSCRAGSVHKRRDEPSEQAYDVVTDGDGFLVTRDSFARGWTARVDGAPAAVLRANGKHRAVAVPGGRHEVVLTYDPPGLRAGIAVTGIAAVVALALTRRPAFAGPASTS